MLIIHIDTTVHLTHNGYIKIEDLTKNDLVKTVLHGYQRISIIGHKEMYHKAIEERISDQLYRYSKEEYSEVFEELVLTGGHSTALTCNHR